jgi:hypothetical protein
MTVAKGKILLKVVAAANLAATTLFAVVAPLTPLVLVGDTDGNTCGADNPVEIPDMYISDGMPNVGEWCCGGPHASSARSNRRLGCVHHNETCDRWSARVRHRVRVRSSE